MPKASAAAGWPGAVLRLKSAESTQDIAKTLAERGARDRTLVMAERQTRGRGRLGRRWTSSKGGLYLSIILRPRISPRLLGQLSLAAAAAAAKAARELSGLETKVKPPNDVLARSDGPWKKICGILIEASGGSGLTDWVVIGLGMNVNNRLPARLSRAASLRGLTGREYDLERAGRSVVSTLLAGLRPGLLD